MNPKQMLARAALSLSLVLAFLVMPLPAQTSAATATAASPAASASPAALPTKPISKGYVTIVLGMAYQAAYDALRANPAIDYRGTPDVSMSPGRDEKIIETRGGRFIKRGTFQFRQEKLFTIILEMEPQQLDYYSLFTAFSARYGDPVSLNPQETIWEDATVRLILEKPCTVKYLDRAVIENLLQQSTIQASRQEESRQLFIDRL
mgnify:FL=1